MNSNEKAYKTDVARLGHKATITVFLDTTQAETEILQFFRLDASDVRYLRYFYDDKFIGYHKLHEALKNYYIGDGENILFDRKESYRNIIVVHYKKLVPNIEIDEGYKNIEFQVEAPIPGTFGCLDCIYWRNKNRVCMYYKQMGMEIKQNCVDFRQKEKTMAKKKPTIPVAKDPVNRSIQIKLDSIAQSLGLTITELLEQYGNAQVIIEKYDAGELKIINE